MTLHTYLPTVVQYFRIKIEKSYLPRYGCGYVSFGRYVLFILIAFRCSSIEWCRSRAIFRLLGDLGSLDHVEFLFIYWTFDCRVVSWSTFEYLIIITTFSVLLDLELGSSILLAMLASVRQIGLDSSSEVYLSFLDILRTDIGVLGY